MANTHTTLTALFTDIANELRAKKNTTDLIIADHFPAEIENLRTGFDYSNHDVATIPDYAFYGCEDLKSVDCYGLTSVGASAFENCTNLKSVILYEGVTSVGENAFKGCNTIIYCMFDSIPETWNTNWNPDRCEVIFSLPVETWDISATEEDNVIAKLYNSIDEGMYTLIISGSGDMKDYVASKYNSTDGYVTDTPWWYYHDNILQCIITDGIVQIGKCIYYRFSNLLSVTIPNSVTSIGTSAFCGCTSLTSINIPDSVTSIGSGAFKDCTSLTFIIIPDNILLESDSVFYNTAYWNKSSNWENHVLYIGKYLVKADTKLSNFCEVKLGCLYISASAFYNHKSLTSITIPDSITRIGSGAFYNCTSLTSITYTGTVTQWNAIILGGQWNFNTGNYTIHCTDGDIAKDGTVTYH